MLKFLCCLSFLHTSRMGQQVLALHFTDSSARYVLITSTEVAPCTHGVLASWQVLQYKIIPVLGS